VASETGDDPGSATEQKLASLWAEVLKRDRVGLREDFFALGGHSLLAIRLLGRIAKAFGARLPLRTLFDNPTVARLAEVLEPAHPAEAPLAAIWCEVLKREQVGRRENFFTLGGHSLLAIRLLGKIAKQFGVRLPLRALFDHPTVAELAPLVGVAPETGPGVEPIGPASGGIKRRARTSVNPAATDRSET
jgi:acyl carrier protein